MTATRATRATRSTRTTRRPPPPAIRIARAAMTYSKIRRAVNRLPREVDPDQADRLYQSLYRAEDRLLKVCAGARVPDDSSEVKE